MSFKLTPRIALVLIAALFVLPLAVAWMMYTGTIDYRPGSTRNFGQPSSIAAIVSAHHDHGIHSFGQSLHLGLPPLSGITNGIIYFVMGMVFGGPGYHGV